MNAITTTPDNIPTELLSEHRWVVADIEDRHGKTTKVPYCPSNPARRADTTDPSTWSDFETARQLVERGRFPMLGFVLGNGFVGVDLDKCRNPETGVIESWATDIIELLENTEDAYGFPPYRYLAEALQVGGMTYDELREKERLILVSAMESVQIHRLGSDNFTWAETITAALAPERTAADQKVPFVNLTNTAPNSQDFFAMDSQNVPEVDPVSGSEA